jgi:hypothetical protein
MHVHFCHFLAHIVHFRPLPGRIALSAPAQRPDNVASVPCARFRPVWLQKPNPEYREKMYFLISDGIGVVDRWQKSRLARAQSGSLGSGDIWLGE